ncbi:MAG: polyprenyl synthetase family protein [Deltaproteobacteria bacterium]|nr:polyprenyl synthetase family protein [Deltaproteobacteria bacterium]
MDTVFERINEQLTVNLQSDVSYVTQVCEYTLLSGGKRLRPALFILASRLCGYQGDKDFEYSIIFEYLHTASLLHDDVVDESDTRRGQDAAHIVYDNKSVILVGDFLVSKAISLAVKTGLIKLLQILSETAANLTEGQILELLHTRDIDINEPEYDRVIYRKTGALIQSACRSGAIFTGASAEYESGLSEFGQKIGRAFQMIDDLLDYSTTASEFGKPVGHDLDEGKITLPVILALANAAGVDHAELRELILKEKRSPEEFKRVKTLIEKHHGFKQTQEKAETLIKEAKQSLGIFPDIQEKKDLCDLADFIVSRRK